MATETLELEGTWEEILAHREELRGAQVRLIAWRADNGDAPTDENRRMLDWLDEMRQNPWSAEETTILDGFDEFREQHPVHLRAPDDLS